MKHNKRWLPYFIFSILLVSIFACKNNSNGENQNATSPYFKEFIHPNSDAVFRAVSFNLDADAIKKLETAKLYETTSDHLFYELSFPKDTSLFVEYANLQYFFNANNQLDIITADVFLNDAVQEEKLIQALKSYFDDNFKSIKNENGNFPMWKATAYDKKADKELDYTIALKDNPDDFGVSLEFLLSEE
ncbi:MAG: hypothetical protein R2807_10170 [Chitinophagales bacterium]